MFKSIKKKEPNSNETNAEYYDLLLHRNDIRKE